MDWTPYISYMIPALIAAFALVAKVAGDLSAQGEAKQSSRVSRIEGTVSRVAASIAADLAKAVVAGSTGDVLTAVKSAAVATGADYMLSAMPDTLKAAGATRDSLIAMLTGEVSKLTVAAPAVQAAVPPVSATASPSCCSRPGGGR